MNALTEGKLSLCDCLVMHSCVWTSCQKPLRKTGCRWGSCAIPCQQACQTTNMMSAGGERWPVRTDEGESERQAEKSNDMLRQSWEVNGMMEYIYIAEALYPRRRVEEKKGTGKKQKSSVSFPTSEPTAARKKKLNLWAWNLNLIWFFFLNRETKNKCSHKHIILLSYQNQNTQHHYTVVWFKLVNTKDDNYEV